MAPWKRFVAGFLATFFARLEADISQPLQVALEADDCSDDTCALSALQARAVHVTTETTPFEELIKQPLDSASQQISEAVMRKFLPTVVKALKSPDWDHSQLRSLAVDIRALVADVGTKLILARDNSTSMDMDLRGTGYAEKPQHIFQKMQTYTTIAWPIIIEQALAAFGDDGRSPEVVSGVRDGIVGSRKFLLPVIQWGWGMIDYQFHNVQDLLTGNYTEAKAAGKAACATSYAIGLGGLTKVYHELSEASEECGMGKRSVDSQAIETCASDDAAAFKIVSETIATGSDMLWQCFGIPWECHETMNSALASLMNALAASFVMSANCNPTGKEVCRPHVFEALASLKKATGQMETATEVCAVTGQVDASVSRDLNHDRAMPRQK